MNPFKKIATETVMYGMSTMLPRFLNWLMVSYFTRVFSENAFGVVVNIYAWVAILLALLTYGMETSFFRFATRDKRDEEKVYATSMITLFASSFLFSLLMVVFDQPIASFMGFADHPEFIRWFGLIIGIDAFTSIPFAWLRLKNRPIRFFAIKLISVVVTIFFTVFFVSICPSILKGNPNSIVRYIYSPQIGVGYVFISNLLGSIATIFALWPEMKKVKFTFDKDLFVKMIGYGFPILILSLAMMINQNLDKIILKSLLPKGVDVLAQTGIYGANYRLGVIMVLFTQAFRYSFEPFFFSQQQGEKSNKLYADIMKYFVLFGLFIFLSTMCYIDVIKRVIGEHFREGLKVVPLVLLGNLFSGIAYNLSLWYKLSDRTRYGAYVALLGSAVTIVFNILLVPFIGYMGAAITGFLCFFVMALTSYTWGQKYYPIPYDLRRMGFYFVVSIGLYIISTIVHPHGIILNFLWNTLLMGLFLYTVYVKEKSGILKLLKK
ncbi:MAG: oligosaccharide flippase family protein [Bacteroidota bacterium]|nr:oligosaccharide flippase family protein [Bacteroidota bacterium]